MEEPQVVPSDPTPRPKRVRARRAFAGAAVIATVAAGGLTIAAVNPLGIAGAQSGDSNQSTTTTPWNGGHHRGEAAGSKVLDESLAALVSDGTLTQAQADAVKAKVKATAETMRTERQSKREERRQAMESTAATALGVSADDLQTQLKAGKTLAQIAQDKGVDVQKVTDALVAEANKRIDQAVTDGKLDATQAAMMKQRTTERIQSFVQNGPKHHRGPEGSAPKTTN